ncbi:hypothetical protein [Chrysiogenes arsenatis]|uniref:hypothetical protein n=1 Tax=Chrysiogenes arsenatis TaxID=309797 RepID=UPI0003FF81EC|nr:hypothetical protein [Chrysiogenes arsenatis]
MDISPLIKQVELVSSDLKVGELRAGSRFEIQVRAHQGGNQLAVILGGKEMVASSETTLAPGRYMVEVQSTTPQLVLKLLPQTTTVPQNLMHKPHMTALPPFFDTNASVIRQPLPLPTTLTLPLFQTSVSQAPTIQVPTPQAPIAQTPTVQAPTVSAPAAQTPTAQPPTVPAPAVQAPTLQTPTVPAPAVQTPTAQAPTIQTPAAQTPTPQAPTVQAPATQAPTVQAPTVQTPATQVPTAQAPISPIVPASPPLIINSLHTPTQVTMPMLPLATEILTIIGRPLEQAILDLSALAREATATQRAASPESAIISSKLDWKNLQHVIANSGLFMERRLFTGEKGIEDDLKIKLMKLVRKFSESEQIMGALTRKINFLTKEQVANLVLKENGIFLIDIPLPTDKEIRQIKIRYRKRGKNSPELDSDILSIYVNMTQLGEVKANIFLARDAMQIALFSQQPNTHKLLEKTAPLLALTIKQETGKEVQMRCVLADGHLYAEFDENLVLLEAMRGLRNTTSDE